MKVITGAQMRAARGLLRWSADDLAKEAQLGIATVRRAEGVDGLPNATRANLAAIRTALEQAGVSFLSDGDVATGHGVSLKP